MYVVVQVLYFPSGSVVSTYSLATGEKLSDLRGHHATINAAAWSTRQTSLITGSTDKQLLLWSPGAAPQDSPTGAVSLPWRWYNRKYTNSVSIPEITIQ